MSKENYILKNQVHFGSLKTSVPKGTKIIVDRQNNIVNINGVEHDNINEVDMCIKAGFIIPFVEGETQVDSSIKISPKAIKKDEKKLEVFKSDVDNMSEDIDISNTKNEVRKANRNNKLEVIKEENDGQSRGMKVITNDSKTGIEITKDSQVMQVVNGDDGQVVAKIAPKLTKPKGVPENNTLVGSTDNDALESINGEQGRVVKSISKSENSKSISSGKKLVSKHASKSNEEKAKATAEARKKASEARRAANKNK